MLAAWLWRWQCCSVTQPPSSSLLSVLACLSHRTTVAYHGFWRGFRDFKPGPYIYVTYVWVCKRYFPKVLELFQSPASVGNWLGCNVILWDNSEHQSNVHWACLFTVMSVNITWFLWREVFLIQNEIRFVTVKTQVSLWNQATSYSCRKTTGGNESQRARERRVFFLTQSGLGLRQYLMDFGWIWIRQQL